MASGYIKDYDDLSDVANNFNPVTEVFTVGNKDEQEGTYIFSYSGYKIVNGNVLHIYVHKNEELHALQINSESDWMNSLQINGFVTVYLKKGDIIMLKNYNDKSIWIENIRPFTFTGHKIWIWNKLMTQTKNTSHPIFFYYWL